MLQAKQDQELHYERNDRLEEVKPLCPIDFCGQLFTGLALDSSAGDPFCRSPEQTAIAARHRLDFRPLFGGHGTQHCLLKRHGHSPFSELIYGADSAMATIISANGFIVWGTLLR